MRTVVDSLDELPALIGTPLGPSPWLEVDQNRINTFADATGDHQWIHTDVERARRGRFGGTIVHGLLTASLLSAVVGTKLPGPGCIYMSQTLKFLAPVRVGDTVYATCMVKQLFPDKHRVLLDTKCIVGDSVVIDGEALIKVPSRN